MMQTDELILLPGTLCDARVFAPVLAPVGLGGLTIALEGTSSAPGMARIVLERAPRRFALCGFSLGAIVALEVLAQAPERVTRLALIGGNPRAIAAEAAVARREAVARAEREGTASYVTTAWDASVPAARHGDSKLLGELEAMARATSLSAFRDQVEMSIDRRDHRPMLRSIAVPTLIVVGAEDRVCPPDLSREMAVAIPHARLVVVDGAGHYVTLDRPQALARELRDWLAAPAVPPTELSKELS